MASENTSHRPEFYWSPADTPVGPVVIVAGPEGLYRVGLGVTPERAAEYVRDVSENSERADEQLTPVVEALNEFLLGTRREFPYVLDTYQGSEFDRSVWSELRRIPRGTTRTYGAIASLLGMSPGAARAVGQACGRNPLPLVIPCHRVIASDGSLGGYAGGPDLKARLLKLEGVLLV